MFNCSGHIKVYFDGGLGRSMYGSWEVVHDNFSKKISRESFDPYRTPSMQTAKKTCNVAEWLSLIGALEWLASCFKHDSGHEAKMSYGLDIFGDSQLVLRQLYGSYACHKPHLKQLCHRALLSLEGYGIWRTHWHSRVKNVSRFGH